MLWSSACMVSPSVAVRYPELTSEALVWKCLLQQLDQIEWSPPSITSASLQSRPTKTEVGTGMLFCNNRRLYPVKAPPRNPLL